MSNVKGKGFVKSFHRCNEITDVKSPVAELFRGGKSSK